MTQSIVSLAAAMYRQSAELDEELPELQQVLANARRSWRDAAWTKAQWEEAEGEFLRLVASEPSAYRLGHVLQYDITNHLPFEIVKATYERLFQLGLADAVTRSCYASYLLAHGPSYDETAHAILDETRPLLEASGFNPVTTPEMRAAGYTQGASFGHHPVFLTGPGRVRS